MDLLVHGEGSTWYADYGARRWRCAIGRGGIVDEKREGDGATPVGCFTLRRVLYRADRVAAPEGILPATPIDPADGWCDDLNDSSYNCQVRLPYEARHERLWREDAIYDVIAILSHNDDPPVPGKGSAIFLHVARPEYRPTRGCVALALPDLVAFLRAVDSSSRVCVQRESRAVVT